MKILQLAVNTYIKNINERPSCFSKKEWKTWLMHEDIAHTEPRRFPCRDCTHQYKKSMENAGRCLIPGIDISRITR